MKTTITNANAGGQPGAGDTAKTTHKRKIITKIDRVIEALKQPEGMNRFDAERMGDHCLNSSVAVIRTMYGERLIQRWERVPSRFNPDGVRVYRYWLL
ncbi:MAG TPA: hypothetical protein PLU47_15610 [Azonexus sp.]|nr:hypothetical protein [Azonexus sp.]